MSIEEVAVMSGKAPAFYVAILILILIIAAIVFFIVKLKQNFKQILKSLGITALISIIFEFVIMLPFSFWAAANTFCSGFCPGPWDIFKGAFVRTIVFVFIIVVFIYYLVKYIKGIKK